MAAVRQAHGKELELVAVYHALRILASQLHLNAMDYKVARIEEGWNIMSRTKGRIYSDIAIPPGKILLDSIKALSISQTELARRMDRPVQAINKIIEGKKEITADTATQLEDVLGTPAYIWLNLERGYRLKIN